MRRTAFIPVIQPGGDGASDRLVESYGQMAGIGEDGAARSSRSDLDRRAREKDWDPIAAPLRKAGLYQAGCVAAGAARKVGLKRPFVALYQMLRPRDWIENLRLHTNGNAMLTEGESAQLGLSLALFLTAAGASTQRVIATGALGAQPPESKEDDAVVDQVGSVPAKLRLVLRLARSGQLPPAGGNDALWFFTPVDFTENGEIRPTRSLPEVEELLEYGVKVQPVATLREALRHLKIAKARVLGRDRAMQAAAAVLAITTVLGFGYQSWKNEPISMAFLAANDHARAEPFQVCFTADGRYRPVDLVKTGVVPVIDDGATIAWRVRVGGNGEDETLLPDDGYWVSQLMLSEFSAAKAVSPRIPGQGDFLRIEPGDVWEWSWELEEREETSMLILLSQRHARIDSNQLRNALVEAFPAAASNDRLDITAASNFVTSRIPGAVTFIFQTSSDKDRCRE